MTATGEVETFDLEQVCKITGAPSPDWLYRRIVSGEFTAVLAGRDWRMTHTDMVGVVASMRAAALAKLAKFATRTADEPAADEPAAPPKSPAEAAGLSKRGAARMRRKVA